MLKPGDILEGIDPLNDEARRWRVLGVYIGVVGQESLVELEPLTERPGWADDRLWTTTFVPEPLLRMVPRIRRPQDPDHDD